MDETDKYMTSEYPFKVKKKRKKFLEYRQILTRLYKMIYSKNLMYVIISWFKHFQQ